MRRFALVVSFVAVVLATNAAAFAGHVDVEVLLADPEAFQGEVSLTGELVGDYGWRGDGWVWAQLNDDHYVDQPLLEHGSLAGGNVGVGIRMPYDLAEKLGPPGGYRERGPVVEATGRWVYHDASRWRRVLPRGDVARRDRAAADARRGAELVPNRCRYRVSRLGSRPVGCETAGRALSGIGSVPSVRRPVEWPIAGA